MCRMLQRLIYKTLYRNLKFIKVLCSVFFLSEEQFFYLCFRCFVYNIDNNIDLFSEVKKFFEILASIILLKIIIEEICYF